MAQPGQELCLRCGARVGRTYRRPPSWRVPAALAALGILLIGAGAGFAVADLSHKKDKKKTVVPLVPRTTTTTTTTTAPATTAPATTSTAPTTTEGKRGVQPVPGTTSASPTSATEWPKGTNAWTVVLATAKTRADADSQARKATDKGIPAGVLKASDYANLKGPWVVFAGQYSSRKAAQNVGKSYASRGFKSWHVEHVKRR